MKSHLRSFYLFAAILTSLLSCSTPVSPSGGTSGQDLSKPGAVLRSVSFGSVTLPKSLQENTSGSNSRAVGSSRAVGDVSTLTSLNLPSLKARGYDDFKRMLQTSSTAQIFIDALKTIDGVKNDTLAVNTTIDSGTVTFGVGSGMTLTLHNSGRLKTSLADDGQTLYVYWSLSFPDTSRIQNNSNLSPQDAFDNAPRMLIQMYLIIPKNGPAQAYASHDLDDGGNYLKYWAKVNPATGESIEAASSHMGGSGDSSSVSAVTPSVNNGFDIYKKYSSASYNSETLGYADDQFGGIVSTGTNTYSSDGVSAPTAHPYINVEYYDGLGDLVYQGWGDSATNPSQWSWLSSYNASNSYNLYDFNFQSTHSQPVQFRVKSDWNGSSYAYSISFDHGSTWQDFSTYSGQTIVFHNPVNDSGSWIYQSGDSLYQASSWSYDNSVPSHWIWYTDYFQSYVVPQGETYFGQSYFVNKTYPLKNLLPLKAQYAVGYEVKQKEEQTYYSWESTSGSWNFGTSAPASGTYKDNTLYSWTSYTYWLENKNYKDSSGINTNNPSDYDPDKGDQEIQLNDFQVWYWDEAKQQSVSRKTPAFSTYMADLPPYFGLDAEKTASVEQTQIKLESLYSNRSQYNVSSYFTNFAQTMAQLQASFPSLAGYPGAP